MTDEEITNVEEIKDRLKIEVEEVEAIAAETPTGGEEPAAQPASMDVVEELKNLGRQVAETLRTAWESEERQKMEADVREGIKSFADEVDKVIREARDSDAAQKMREEATELKAKMEEADLAKKARSSLVQGLGWLSDELGKLAASLSPKEKQPEAPAPAEPESSGEEA
ncbi:MAG: hypothetical protein KC418_10190 [Anaerolineales bacterium]|nr:hypothetical protein [Anaerolineales bacterium]MCB8953153.1 hypothetical protein [Ardenticatenales bacterium]